MSKEFKNMDDLFRSTFVDEATEVPAFVKTNIDKKLGFDRKNRFGSLFPAILLIGIVTATTIYFTVDTDESNSAQSNSSTENQTTSTPSNDNTLAVTSNELDDPGTEKNSTQQINLSNSSTNSNQSDINQSLKNNNSTNKKFQLGSNSESENDEINSDNLNTSFTNNTLASKQNPNGNDAGVFKRPSDTSNGNGNDIGFDNNDVEGNDDGSDVSGSSSDSTTNSDENKFVDDQTDDTHQNSDSTLNADDDPTNILSETNENDEDQEGNAPSDLDRDGGKYNPWMLTFTGGLNLTKSIYEPKKQPESDLYEKSTNDRPSFETNFDVKYRLNNGLTFGTGFGLTQFAEIYYFDKTTVDIDTTYTYNYVYDLFDSTLVIDSTIASTEYDTTIVNIYNATGESKASYVTLPINVGTQIIYKKFRFDLFASGRFNYLVSASGGYILNDAFVPFTKNSNPIFKPWYIDMMLGATVHYQIFEKLYLSGTIRYRPPFGQMYQGTTFNKSVQYTHLGIGLSFKF